MFEQWIISYLTQMYTKKKFENIEMETRVETDILRTGFDIGFLLKFLVPDPKQKPYIL